MRSTDRTPVRHGPGVLTAGAVAVAVLVGGWLVHDGSTTAAPPPQPPAADVAAPSPSPSASLPAYAPALPPSPPSRIRIPAIKVNAPVTGVGLDAAGHLTSPPMAERNLAGWYRDAAAPGAAGTAVLLGHVDNRTGPTVFHQLGLLRRGDTVEITRKDRRTAVFTVTDVRTHPKSAFPTQTVYASTGNPELRVLTCGGHFDRKNGGYDSNVVVSARLTATR
ncbi:class F sortase [Kitasatospora sp. NPDC051853]|uniref:class F sortase n=1 Tax=Kitasatospora sp. NPDC051853 TaxID=3364058 RepID=UPI0037B2DA90